MTAPVSTQRTISPAARLRGTVQVPGDKSISHRYAMLAAIADGISEIRNFSASADCRSTLNCIQKLGVRVARGENLVIVHGGGLWGLREPAGPLDAGNSGSTMRMLSGILAGQQFPSVLIGDESLSRRPMKRIIDPLTQMGARISGSEGGRPPLRIEPAGKWILPLRLISYQLPVASAQVKSAILLAGLYADNTEVIEPVPTRDHTEIALDYMGGLISRHGQTIRISSSENAVLRAVKFEVPGDISSATFFLAAALLVPGSELTIPRVGLNPTRTAILDLLTAMGADITRTTVESVAGELRGDLCVRSSELQGGEIPAAMIPAVIDELPVLAVLGSQTEVGLTFRNAAELRVKESDRLAAVSDGLRRMGAVVEEFPDGLHVPGQQKLRGAEIDSYGDHRIAMAFAVAGLVAEGDTVIRDSECVEISFPNFYEVLAAVATGR
jgi:3-phosphoshikimate 1-carboxyvinyltransferase